MSDTPIPQRFSNIGPGYYLEGTNALAYLSVRNEKKFCVIDSGLLSDLVKGSQMILERNGETNFQEKQNFFYVSKKI